MIFYAYIGLMGMAVGLSLFNLPDRRLLALASKYSAIVILFHLIFMSLLHLQKTPEFVLLVAGAQALIAWEAHKIGCRAAKIITPIAWLAVYLNCLTFAFDFYPNLIYFYGMNILQGAQVASLIFASSAWMKSYGTIKTLTRKKPQTKGMSYERAG